MIASGHMIIRMTPFKILIASFVVACALFGVGYVVLDLSHVLEEQDASEESEETASSDETGSEAPSNSVQSNPADEVVNTERQNENLCGDGTCDGPETADLCPADCSE